MDLFSSCGEETIKKKVLCVYDLSLITSETDLVNIFDLTKCLDFIKDNGFSKVCLQFPDNLLQFSVQVALWLERSLNQKVFVLGDTTYSSCCVDELTAQHIEGDAVIHMGHACLSPTSRLPAFHVLPKATLDLTHFISAFTQHYQSSTGSILLLYDIAYNHLVGEISEELKKFGDRVVISQLCIPGYQPRPCSPICELSHGLDHQNNLLGRAFCCNSPASIVYIAYKHSQNMTNFALSLKCEQFFTYTAGSGTETVHFTKILRRRLYLIEKVKDAKTIGILVGTLSVDKFLSAIEQVKKLAAYRSKQCYVFSVGKPNPAKLANFPEIELFVLVSCPEACIENEKEYMQPIVTLMEAELALNSNRQWDEKLSVDFRDLVEGAPYHRPLPEGQELLAPDVSLISNKIRSDLVTVDSETGTELSVNEHYQISVASSYNSGRSWRGLEQFLGETPVSQAKMGRSGIPVAYDEEKAHQTL